MRYRQRPLCHRHWHIARVLCAGSGHDPTKKKVYIDVIFKLEAFTPMQKLYPGRIGKEGLQAIGDSHREGMYAIGQGLCGAPVGKTKRELSHLLKYIIIPPSTYMYISYKLYLVT